MATLLLAIIYLAFISLGLPDSLFGAAWPAIYGEYQLPLSFGSFLTFLSFLGTTISSFCSAKVIRRFGTNKVTAFSTVLTATALLVMSYTGSYQAMCFCAIPLGLGGGAIDAALNNYVSLHYSATHMSFLHCFYGVGVSISPYLLSLVLQGENGWRSGYRMAVLIQAFIAAVLFFTLPIWKNVHKEEYREETGKVQLLSLKEISKIPGVKVMWILFVCACAIECTCGSWGSTFLVEAKGLPVEKAAELITFFYVGMAIGRFLSGLAATRLHSWTIIKLSNVITGLALVVLCTPITGEAAGIVLLFIGLGIGPLFPNFSYLTPENFGEDLSPSVIGTQMAMANISIMITPVIFSVLGQFLGMQIFPIYILLFFMLMIMAVKLADVIFRGKREK